MFLLATIMMLILSTVPEFQVMFVFPSNNDAHTLTVPEFQVVFLLAYILSTVPE